MLDLAVLMPFLCVWQYQMYSSAIDVTNSEYLIELLISNIGIKVHELCMQHRFLAVKLWKLPQQCSLILFGTEPLREILIFQNKKENVY